MLAGVVSAEQQLARLELVTHVGLRAAAIAAILGGERGHDWYFGCRRFRELLVAHETTRQPVFSQASVVSPVPSARRVVMVSPTLSE